MKKILTGLLTFFLLVNNISALSTTYYSEYSDFSSWQEEPIIENDTTKVEIERRYRWYKETMKNGDHYIEEENDPEYSLINRKDTKKTDWSDWQTTPPEEKKNREIKSKEFYEYQDMKKIRYIHLEQFHGENNKLNITEIEVKINGNVIDYEVECENCAEEFSKNIKNQNLLDENNYIEDSGYLRIDLKEEYNLNEFTFIIHMKDTSTERKMYNLYITRDPERNSRIYGEAMHFHWFQTEETETYPKEHSMNSVNITNPEWEEKVLSETKIESSKTRKVTKRTYYQYQDTLYRYYKVEKQYAKNYSTTAYKTYPIQDTSDYKDYYRKKTREKVVIPNHIVITSKKMKLEDFITETTTKNIKIEGDYDITKNGSYKVKFILPFKTVSRTIYVDINRSDALEKKNEELKNVITSINKELANTKNKYNKLEKDVKEKEKEISNLNTKSDNLHQENINWISKQAQNEKIKETPEEKDCVCPDQPPTVEKKSSFIPLLIVIPFILFLAHKKIRKKHVGIK